MVTNVKKTIKQATALILVLILTAGALSMVSCGAPKLDEVKDDFVKLIRDSFEVNEILFGDGLSGYGILEYDEATGVYYSNYYTVTDGRLCAYRDKALGKYVVLRVSDTDGEGCVYKDEARGRYYFPTDLAYSEGPRDLPDAPAGYRHVRADERCTTVNEIATFASTVYSEDYLADLFTILFNSANSTNIDDSYTAKYMEMTDADSGKSYLLCADSVKCPPIYEEDRLYDYNSMKIASKSRSKFVNVEVQAYGKYADVERGEVVTGWHTVRLSFVKQGDGWRLDTPTY